MDKYALDHTQERITEEELLAKIGAMLFEFFIAKGGAEISRQTCSKPLKIG